MSGFVENNSVVLEKNWVKNIKRLQTDRQMETQTNTWLKSDKKNLTWSFRYKNK